ncbi:MAG: hypothetical protein PHT69_12355 [Bacteroidales bacterium]|nr:hypothetical protein [Bacteroidales bacterium]
MNKKFKKILTITFWILITSIIIFLLIRSQKQQNKRLCTALIINIDDNREGSLVSHEEIEQLIRDSIGILVDNKKLSEIDLQKINRIISRSQLIEDVTVFSSLDGEIIVEITQRKPVVRVFNSLGESFYIDKKGIMFPLSQNHTERVVVASGYINEPYRALQKTDNKGLTLSRQILNNIYKVALYISEDNFWNAMISEIIAAENGDLELVPVTGGHKVLFGDVDNIQEKLENLLIFYKEVSNKSSWNKYKTINIKFKDLIYCTE